MVIFAFDAPSQAISKLSRVESKSYLETHPKYMDESYLAAPHFLEFVEFDLALD